jgi:hypothetical protein
MLTALIGSARGSRKRLAVAVSALSLALLMACTPEAPPPTTVAPASPRAALPFSGTATNLTAAQLELLVGPVALYPDDLLALVLPASTQPLQVVDAQRFLEQRKTKPSLQPPKTWDPSVVALLNYPEALARMTADLTWLQQLGTSIVNQQAGVMDAVQAFRRKAFAAGNLKSDDKQTVAAQTSGADAPQTIIIEPASPQVIYVPTYEPTTVVYAPPPGYPYYPYYWSAPYPYYYSPAAPFFMGASVGVVIGYGCDWDDDDIYHGDINVENVNINREQAKERIENRRSSNTASQIRRNPENVWRPDPSGLSRAQAGAGTASGSALQQAAADRRGSGASPAERAALNGRASGDTASRSGRQDLGAPSSSGDFGGDRSYRGSSSGAFSGADRGAAASRYSARGAGSMGGGFRGGGARGGRR